MLTEAQKAARRRGIFASEVAAVLGLDQWRTPYEVWASKMLDLREQPATEAIELGNELEPVVLARTARQLGVQIEPCDTIISKEVSVIGAHLDARVIGHPACVEAKTSGIVGPRPSHDEWGDFGSDAVAPRVVCQVQVQMFVAELEVAYVGALLGGRGFGVYTVGRSDELIQRIVDRLLDWHARHIVGQTPPDANGVDPSFFQRIIRKPGKVISLPSPDPIVRYAEAAANVQRATLEKESAQAALLAMLGDAETAVTDDGHLATYVEISRKGYTVEPTKYRRLKVSAP